ncbi:hypothetical protein ABE437_03350 [Isoptericola cucumis]|uniref:hypothetical protein n=1 Tax=Isoptericola cucumis TaxID=1776856 RepID=UPI003207DED4
MVGATADPVYEGKTDNNDDNVTVEGSSNAWTQTAHGREPAASDEPQDRYVRTDARACATLSDIDTIEAIATAPGACPDGTNDVEIIPACDGIWLDALWVQRAAADGTYGDAEQLSDDQCITPADVAAAARREFRTMKIPTPEATLQGRPPMVVNVHYPAYTAAEAQEQQVELLSVPVVIRAEPTQFEWDFDDPHSPGGGSLVTTEPGRPWSAGDPTPDRSWVGHTYSRLGTPGMDDGTDVDEQGNVFRSGVTVSLTTTWQGRFRVQGTSTWTDIPDTITTTSTTEPTTVTEARTRLVCDDLALGATC